MSDTPDVLMAADIGGTFTDVVLQIGERRLTRKVLTTPDRPEVGMLGGLGLVLEDAGASFADIRTLVHGTTLATNAIIERNGAKTALVSTKGFRDTLEIATESRFDQYDLMIEKPTPLVPRSLRFTVPERVDVNGRVLLPLDENALPQLAEALHDVEVEAVAVCFLHSYANAEHELRVRQYISGALPGVAVCLSHQVCPEAREYERASTTVANAYVQPRIEGYLGRLASQLEACGFSGTIFLMTSGGGLTSLEAARAFPVRLVESGPAGGAIFAAGIAAVADEHNVLSFDMGGTTAKICLIEGGEPSTTRLFEVDRMARFMKGSGLPLRIPVMEMVEIGAGGGSIAQVDSVGQITIGPRSVSSKPGPACYDLGGDFASVTDADLVIGLLDPDSFANGAITLRPDLSTAALAKDVGDKLGVDATAAAYGVFEMVCENMTSAARMHAAECGANLEAYTMIAFGGAAPLHAARVAEKAGIGKVLIPANAGVGSAVGFLAAPIAYEIVRSSPQRLGEDFDFDGVNSLLAEMSADAHTLVEAGAAGEPLFEKRVAFMRYVGQGHEITVDLPDEMMSPRMIGDLRARFEAEYTRQFSRIIPLADIEAINWSVLVSTRPGRPQPAPGVPRRSAMPPCATRLLFDGRTRERIEVPVYHRHELGPGMFVDGPALITEVETTVFVTAHFDAHIDGAGCIVLQKKA